LFFTEKFGEKFEENGIFDKPVTKLVIKLVTKPVIKLISQKRAGWLSNANHLFVVIFFTILG
jgi:hypothetical protein